MSRRDDLRELSGEIRRHLEVSAELIAVLRRIIADDVPRIGRTTTTSLAVAGLIENYYTALETMRFRHFKRYYFQLDYDWNRLDYLTGLLERVQPNVDAELTAFDAFLGELIETASGS